MPSPITDAQLDDLMGIAKTIVDHNENDICADEWVDRREHLDRLHELASSSVVLALCEEIKAGRNASN